MLKKFIKWYIRWSINHTHYLYLDGQISMDEHDERIHKLKLMKCKWVNNECHHFCFLCEYRGNCYPSINPK